MALLTVENVTLGYAGRQVVSGLSFSVNAGEYWCILGENGSGKTTLMRAVLGLQSPMAGRILRGDGLKENEVGYLPQQTPIQRDFPASVEEIVLTGCLNRLGRRPFYGPREREAARLAMVRLGVLPWQERCYRELSGGQQQRVLLARALCAGQRLLLLDEPVAGLDPLATQQMYDGIRQLNRQGLTVVMISHDVAGAVSDASHVLCLGRRIFAGTRQDYLQQREAGWL